MKKKLLALLPVLIAAGLMLLSFLPKGGDIRPVRREIGDSRQFTAEEIESAMQVAERHFKKEFEGCTLFEITYDEDYSDKRAPGWAEIYGAEECIVLVSRFWAGKNSKACFNPESYYDNWQWILTRNPGETWTLRTWGYG